MDNKIMLEPLKQYMMNKGIEGLTVDLGNSDAKSVRLGHKHVQIMPHGLKFISDSEWKRVQDRSGSSRGDVKTMRFRMRGKNAIVGKGAADSGALAPRSGPQKYSKDYLRFICAAQMVKHFPEGCSKPIYLAVAHPPDAVPFRNNINKALVGKYNILMEDGRKLTFIIKEVRCFDEPGGGVVRWLGMNSDGLVAEGINQSKLMVVDVGGRISSLTEVEINRRGDKYNIEIKFDDSTKHRTYYSGILNIYEALDRELVSLHSDLVSPLMPLINHKDILEGIVRTKGTAIIGGKPHDVTQAYLNAIGPFESTFNSNYSALGRGKAQDIVVLTGGGTAALSQFFLTNTDYASVNYDNKAWRGNLEDHPENWLGHDYVHYANQRSKINLANVLGGNLIHLEALIADGVIKGDFGG